LETNRINRYAYADHTALEKEIEQYIRTSMNPRTKDTYEPYRRQYVEFCKERGYDMHGDRADLYVAQFMRLKADGIKTHDNQRPSKKLMASTLSSTVLGAVADVYRLEEQNPTTSKTVKNMMKVIERTAPPPGSHVKDRLPSAHMIAIIKEAIKDGSLKACRDVCILLISYLMIVRERNVVNLKTSDITFEKNKNGMERINIKIEDSKNDQKRKGFVQTVNKQPPNNEGMCVVRWMKAYLRKRDANNQFLFYNLNHKQYGNRLADTTPTHLLREWLKKTGMTDEHTKRYTSNSLRKAATSKAFEAGHTESEVKMAGNWRSDAVHNYNHIAKATKAAVADSIAQTKDADDDTFSDTSAYPETLTTKVTHSSAKSTSLVKPTDSAKEVSTKSKRKRRPSKKVASAILDDPDNYGT